MFHMLSCFDLEPGTTIGEFQESIVRFTALLQQRKAVESVGKIGRRQKHPIMDTDDERDHEYYLIMTFRDREQCDFAVSLITPHTEPEESVHNAVSAGIVNGLFVCWEDL